MWWFMLLELLLSYFVLPSDFLTISIVHVHHFCHILYRKYLFNYIVSNIPVIQYKLDVKVFVAKNLKQGWKMKGRSTLFIRKTQTDH
jgi:hypothetical protein